MKERLRQLERVKLLRSARERMGEAAVAVEAARLRRAEQRLMEAKETQAAEERESQRAMDAGERPAWLLSQALREADRWDRRRFEADCEERRERMSAAQKMLDERRIESEQASELERGVREALLVEQERRAQAASDDRFLARRRWRTARAGVKALIQTE